MRRSDTLGQRVLKNKRVSTVVEIICERGCRYVNAILQDARKRASCRPLVTLSSAEQASVIKELKSVMSVYDKTGSCDI